MSRLPARSHYGKHVFNTTGHKPVFNTIGHRPVFDTTVTGASSTRADK